MSVLDEVAYPPGWKRVRLGAIGTRVSDAGFGHLEPLSVFLGDGVVPRANRDDNHNQLGADLEKYQRVLPGDLVFNKLRTWQGGFGVSAHTGIVSPAYIIARPTAAALPRFLHHFMRSDPVLAELTRLSKWMPPSQFDISWEDIREVSVALPPMEEQRRIADFLDDQVARIDSLIAAREAQVKLLDEARVSRLRTLFETGQTVPVRRLVREAVVGIVVQPAALYTDDADGIPALRGSDVSEASIAGAGHVKLTPAGHAMHPRSRLEAGDVVVVRTGDAGAAAVVPAWANGWNCIDLVVLRVDSRMASAAYLESALNAARVGMAVEAASSGSIQQHFGVGAILALPTVARSLDDQEGIVREVASARLGHHEAEARMNASIGLLNEYKRSLITAAVTGEFDVTTARTGVSV